jgi:hypothetical protein
MKSTLKMPIFYQLHFNYDQTLGEYRNDLSSKIANTVGVGTKMNQALSKKS